jgi:hypothetical protein
MTGSRMFILLPMTPIYRNHAGTIPLAGSTSPVQIRARDGFWQFDDDFGVADHSSRTRSTAASGRPDR